MLQIKEFVFSPVQENTYVVYNGEGWCIIVDPGCYFGNERNELKDFIGEHQLSPKYLLNTHCHLDHVFGNKFIHDTYHLSLHLHKKEEAVLAYAPISGVQWGLPFDNYRGDLIFLDEGDSVMLGEDRLSVLFTPGHSPGSISFHCEAQQFVLGGDVLFRESIGRTDLPGGDSAMLLSSIQNKLWPLSDSTIVYPGHGPATTIGHEKKHNPFMHQAIR